MEDFNKPIWQLTIRELVDILDSRSTKVEHAASELTDNRTKYV